MGNQCLVSGDYAEAFRFGQEAVTIAQVQGPSSSAGRLSTSIRKLASVDSGVRHFFGPNAEATCELSIH